MGGNSNSNRQLKKASPIGFLSFFKLSAKRSRKVEDSRDNSMKADKGWRSDDYGGWVAHPNIDREASAYIARILAATKNNVNGVAAADQQ